MTISGAAFGSLEVVQWALIYVLALVLRRQWMKDGAEKAEQERAERRSLRRMEARTSAYTARRPVSCWPGPDLEQLEQLASTDQLRQLEHDAEHGNLKAIRGTNAAFMRVFDLIGYNRKAERRAAEHA